MGFEAAEMEALALRHRPMVYRRAHGILGNHEDAEEAVQEVFLSLMSGPFSARENVTGWLYRITTNYCLGLLRKQKRRHELYREQVLPMAPFRASVASVEDLGLLRWLLSEADERQAQAAVYVYLDGLSHEKAAGLMGVSKRTVGNLLERFAGWAKACTTINPPPGGG